MNYLKILALSIVIIFISESVKSQNFSYTKIDGRLSNDQKAIIKDADSEVSSAEKLINKAEKIESKYEKYQDSKKKRKRKKWEKKTWQAKLFRIQAGSKYKIAFADVIEVYNDIIENSKYYYLSDETAAKELNASAAIEMEAGNKNVDKFSKKKSKKVLKKTKHSKVVKAMEKSKASYQNALNKQFKALEILVKQDEKKRQKEEEKQAWEYASETNTIASYQEFLEKYPNCEYSSAARNKISELEELLAQKSKEKNMPNPNGYVFHVQMATSPIRLYSAAKAAIYSDPDKVIEFGHDGAYKYYVGDFDNYADAYKFGMENISKVPSLFIIVFDKDGNQIEVTEDMKPENLKGKYPR